MLKAPRSSLETYWTCWFVTAGINLASCMASFPMRSQRLQGLLPSLLQSPTPQRVPDFFGA